MLTPSGLFVHVYGVLVLTLSFFTVLGLSCLSNSVVIYR